MLVDLQSHARRPPANHGSATGAAVAWVLPDPSAFDVMVNLRRGGPRGHDIPPSGEPQKANRTVGDDEACAKDADTARCEAAGGAPGPPQYHQRRGGAAWGPWARPLGLCWQLPTRHSRSQLGGNWGYPAWEGIGNSGKDGYIQISA